ncbi:hypothetical protein SCLCIDRAFT_27185 [Scleroderma citrinum Foug A]|uniref:Hydantoinase/oxoprolinase N-terminal domain-containing protein n=1 Tax=Scleroderma citrinum Foug A TaxID=1036808 RepID=A0A0C2ZCY8_9AGAM|nr:hypothetical protein SCLCIDRAFT_27185 [Scleroderma citrinum Foug A]
MLRLGVDVGGTDTDAVLLDTVQGIVAAVKRPTTPDVTRGIQLAIEGVGTHLHSVDYVQAISIAFVNALIERDPIRLDPFPLHLRSLLEGPSFLLSGGLQIDGSKISPVEPSQVESACTEIAKRNIHAVVVSSVFAPIDFAIKQEEHVASLVCNALKDVDVVCSKDVAHIGLLERENAAILNASLLRYAKKTVSGFQHAARNI